MSSCGTQAGLQLQRYPQSQLINDSETENIPNWLQWEPILQTQGRVATSLQNRILVRHNWAYVIDPETYTLQIINVTNPWNPRVVRSHNLDGLPTGLGIMKDHFLIISLWGGKAQVVDVTNPLAPVTVMCCAGDDYLHDVAVEATWAYIASSNGHLQIIDFSNITNPIFVDTKETITTPNRVIIHNSLLYVLEQSGFQIADLTVPSTPIWKVEWPLPGQPLDLVVTTLEPHQKVIVLVVTTIVIQMIDVTIPTTPQLLANLSFSGREITVNGPWAYLVDGIWLSRIDLRDLTTTPIGFPVITHLHTDENTLITTDGLKIYTEGSRGL